MVSKLRKMMNYGIAVIKYVANGRKNVTKHIYEKRLKVCIECPLLQSNNECGACGCPIAAKALWYSEDCPKGYWKKGVPMNNKVKNEVELDEKEKRIADKPTVRTVPKRNITTKTTGCNSCRKKK